MAPVVFDFFRHNERSLSVSERTKIEALYAVPVERQIDYNSRLLHESLAASFILHPHRPMPEHVSKLKGEKGKPLLDDVRKILAAHARQVQTGLEKAVAALPKEERVELPSDYVKARVEHDVKKFCELIKSNEFKAAILQEAGIRKPRASLPEPTGGKAKSWSEQSPSARRKPGRPRKSPLK